MTDFIFDSIDDHQNIAMKNRYSEEVTNGRAAQEVLAGLQLLSRDNSPMPMQWNNQGKSGLSDRVP